MRRMKIWHILAVGMMILVMVGSPWALAAPTSPAGRRPVFRPAIPFQQGASPRIDAIDPDAGFNDRETLVTISGDGFSDPTTVTLDTTPLLTVTVVNTTTITAVVPPGLSPGYYDLYISTAAGDASLTDAFLVLEPTTAPDLVVEEISPDQVPPPIDVPFTLMVRVRNRGSVPVTQTAWIGLYKDRPPLGDPDQQMFVPPLEGGQKATVYYTVLFLSLIHI